MIRIKELRSEKNMNMRQTAMALDIPYTTYISYEKSEREPNSEMLIKLADFFNCSIDYLLGRTNQRINDDVLDKVNQIDDDLLEKYGNLYEAQKAQNIRDAKEALPPEDIQSISLSEYDNIRPIQLKRFPMLGEIACGEPIFADEDREHYIMADMDIKADFCLTAKGDSMINARIYDGDVVFIRQTDMVENGEIAAVIIDDEATLKRVYYDRESNFLQLVAENPKYKPLVYRDEQLDEVHILGKAVYFMSAL